MRRVSLVHLRPWSCISTPALRQLPRPLGAGSVLPHVASVHHDPARCVDACVSAAGFYCIVFSSARALLHSCTVFLRFLFNLL